jgi:hypothetical protein
LLGDLCKLFDLRFERAGPMRSQMLIISDSQKK